MTITQDYDTCKDGPCNKSRKTEVVLSSFYEKLVKLEESIYDLRKEVKKWMT
jgi:hypothetical protein